MPLLAFLSRSLAASPASASSASVASAAALAAFASRGGACFFVAGAGESVFELCRTEDSEIGWTQRRLFGNSTATGDFTWAIPLQGSGGSEDDEGSTDLVALTLENTAHMTYFDVSSGEMVKDVRVPLHGQPVGGDVFPLPPGPDVRVEAPGPSLVIALFNEGVGLVQGRVEHPHASVYDYGPAIMPPGNWMAQHKVHNAKVFTVSGMPELFINDLGNSFSTEASQVPGFGLVHVRTRSTYSGMVVRSFQENTTTHMEALGENYRMTGLHARSSAQDPTREGWVYVLTQEVQAPTIATRLVALRFEEAEEGIKTRIAAVVDLPVRGECYGEGGADVLALGGGRVLVTDRFSKCAGFGRMYTYQLQVEGSSDGAPVWQRCSFGAGDEEGKCGADVCKEEAGESSTEVCFVALRGNPRYTTAMRAEKPGAGHVGEEIFNVVSTSNNWGEAGHGDVTVVGGLLGRAPGGSSAEKLRVRAPALWNTAHVTLDAPVSIAFSDRKTRSLFKSDRKDAQSHSSA